jgi:hypothetical protein
MVGAPDARGSVRLWHTSGLANGRVGAHIRGMATRPKIRLLEVSVTAQEPTVWRWHISEHDLEVLHGYETSRESAQIEGDTALFKLLSGHRI